MHQAAGHTAAQHQPASGLAEPPLEVLDLLVGQRVNTAMAGYGYRYEISKHYRPE